MVCVRGFRETECPRAQRILPFADKLSAMTPVYGWTPCDGWTDGVRVRHASETPGLRAWVSRQSRCWIAGVGFPTSRFCPVGYGQPLCANKKQNFMLVSEAHSMLTGQYSRIFTRAPNE